MRHSSNHCHRRGFSSRDYPVSDNDNNYTMSPAGDDDQQNMLPPANEVTADNAAAMDQLL